MKSTARSAGAALTFLTLAACSTIPALEPGADPFAPRVIAFGLASMRVDSPERTSIRFECSNLTPTTGGASWVSNCEAVALAVLKQERAAGRLGYTPRQYPLLTDTTAFLPLNVLWSLMQANESWLLVVKFDRQTGKLLFASPGVPREWRNAPR